jgi:hypothetical protein
VLADVLSGTQKGRLEVFTVNGIKGGKQKSLVKKDICLIDIIVIFYKEGDQTYF